MTTLKQKIAQAILWVFFGGGSLYLLGALIVVLYGEGALLPVVLFISVFATVIWAGMNA